MDYDRCVGHVTRGKRQGFRCEKEGTLALGVDKFMVCDEHSAWIFRYTRQRDGELGFPPWLKDIITRALKGRYDGP